MEGRRLNLWDLMVSAVHRKEESSRKFGAPVPDDVLADLEASTQMHGQEISLRPTEKGWLIEVFSCYAHEEPPTNHWFILVPTDGGVPVVSGRWPIDVVEVLSKLR